ncbi:uncharacterized protein BX664DRAFT_385398 [Halteromyces radiatus]|uniref:uncharacterized protein n=1 Tax=Halteromyces radiatus TaxID=101107 RepID=UPI002220AA98|nr:uncharacterized protein BX664DRAFT_385398 [Halteromyces radiatus]KAI8088795.1 hypothetical protein BX664DRAFT_385398 [Halteromyces radiatus]
MGAFSQAFSQEEIQNGTTHDLLAGQTAYQAAKKYDDYCESNGKPDGHAKAKEMLSNFISAAVNELAETKSLDFIDKQEVKRHAEEQIFDQYDQYYGLY